MFKWIDETRELLGTQVRLIVGCGAEGDVARVAAAFDECGRIEKNYSRFLVGNELARLNAGVGDWVKVGEELFDLIKVGVELGARTEGAFDLRVKGILEDWGYDDKYSFVEREAGGEVGESRGFSKGGIELKVVGEAELGYFVKLDREIELGGLGKGYAIDRMAGCLRGIENFSINAGGDIFAKGRDFEGKIWKFLFEHPTDIKQTIGFVEVDGFALACSSPTKRKWKDKHHLVDPVAGAPANGMLAIYVQASTALVADSYATALFVLGFQKAKKLMERLPLEVMMVAPNGEIYKSAGFKGELFVSN